MWLYYIIIAETNKYNHYEKSNYSGNCNFVIGSSL